MWRIEFVSADFLPIESEEDQVNPGIYGCELAQWLLQALATRGLRITDPIGEDWGWLLQYSDDKDILMIGCASMSKPGEGYTGKPIAWSIFVEKKKRWFRRAGSNDSEQRFGSTIIAALAGHGITNVQLVEG